jgi:hypothetical protein
MTQEIKVNAARFTELWRPALEVANEYKRCGLDLTYCEVREIANTNLALFFTAEQREVPHLIVPCMLTSQVDVLGVSVYVLEGGTLSDELLAACQLLRLTPPRA